RLGVSEKRDPQIYVALADIHQKMIQEEPERRVYHEERSIHFLQAACKLEPTDAYLKYLLAKAYLRCGNLALARRSFAVVREMEPETYYGKAAAKLAHVKKLSFDAED
ncbi:MAG: tetratricopeptide repeat protein, partial [Syntrophobacteria bacterium]